MRIEDYPRTKLADGNDIITQINHIKNELDAFTEAWVLACHYKHTFPNKEKFEHFLREMAMKAQDGIQSFVTLVDIVDKQHPEVQAWGYRPKMIEKNDARGYNSKGVEYAKSS
jgi:hypothetical protein